MKKMNILKIAFTLVLAFVFYGASAQILAVGEAVDYEDATTVAVTSYMTEGTTMPFWALPDANYHPAYDPETDDISADGFTWAWTAVGLTIGSDDDDNYVTLAAPSPGATTDYTVTVAETAPVAWGGCADVTPVSLTVRTVVAPTINVATADIINYCGDQAAESIVLNIAEDVPTAIAAYAFLVEETIEEIDATDAVVATPTPTHTFVEYTTAVKLIDTDADWGGAQPAYTYTFNSTALTVSSGNRTRYTYTLLNDATHGIVSGISHKSDYLAGAITYNAAGDTDATVIFIVNPTPVTGPIYHILNDLEI
ncbi:MAG: hypothetical protein KOO66_06485 [Bacteroidales bacterium]|nr:hypothetical protein [Bacteroidales bacterium]